MHPGRITFGYKQDKIKHLSEATISLDGGSLKGSQHCLLLHHKFLKLTVEMGLPLAASTTTTTAGLVALQSHLQSF